MSILRSPILVFFVLGFGLTVFNASATPYRNPFGKMPSDATDADKAFAAYFRTETLRLQERCLADIHEVADLENGRPVRRQQLQEMLGLDPMPPRSDLKATITGTLEQPDFTVEKLHFQSMPGLYVTGNLYVPKNLQAPAPTVLYLCGHAKVKIDGVSYGNKTHYQHWGSWFARNGYVCLILDSVQLGEIEGIHSAFQKGQWWWNSRGYSAAGAEAWNCIRALDYLETRPEVDRTRIGVTGRSGGGSYSWTIAALDDRIKVACPTAGMTDMQNHVVDGCIEGHCGCMFTVNTYRWDYPQIAALVAPRPLLICNTDKDTIFPLDGVSRLHEKIRGIYELYNAPEKLGLLIVEGPHKESQDLQVPVMRWFNKWLKKDEGPLSNYAEKLFSPQQLRVFDKIPSDEITSQCFETFTHLASDIHPIDPKKVLAELNLKTFGAWPKESEPVEIQLMDSAVAQGGDKVWQFQGYPEIKVRLRCSQSVPNTGPKSVHLIVKEPEDAMTHETLGIGSDSAWTVLTPSGAGEGSLSADKQYEAHARRRFMQLGGTLAGMQVWEVRRAVQALRAMPETRDVAIHLHASTGMTEVACFATLFETGINTLHLEIKPRSDKDAPDFLNWARIITPKQLLQLAQEKCTVMINAAAPH